MQGCKDAAQRAIATREAPVSHTRAALPRTSSILIANPRFCGTGGLFECRRPRSVSLVRSCYFRRTRETCTLGTRGDRSTTTRIAAPACPALEADSLTFYFDVAASGAVFMTESIPLSREVSDSYISLLPMT